MTLENSKLAGDLDLSSALFVEASNFSYGFLSQFGVPVLFSFGSNQVLFPSKLTEGMQHVFGASHNLKVFKPVIRLDAILMIDLFSFWNRAEKSGDNSAVDEKISTCSASAITKIYMQIATFILGWFPRTFVSTSKNLSIGRSLVSRPSGYISPTCHVVSPKMTLPIIAL